MTKFKPKLSILPKEQKALWPHLAPAKDLGFTLYGGSAIALRLGHRSSVDFDFFTEKTLAKNALYKAIPVLKGSDVLQEAPDALVVSVTPPRSENPVKLSFFAKMNFGRFGTPELTDDGVLRVASLDDLMATKLKVILDRTEEKDYEDLAAMICAGAQVARGLAIARQMFERFGPQTGLLAMVYHKDVPKLSLKARRTLIAAAKTVKSLPEVTRASTRLSEDVAEDDGAGRAPPPSGTRRPK